MRQRNVVFDRGPDRRVGFADSECNPHDMFYYANVTNSFVW